LEGKPGSTSAGAYAELEGESSRTPTGAYAGLETNRKN